MSATPLKGLKVLEMSHAIMGPTAGLILADLGAEVIKVEPGPSGDPTRYLGGFAAGFFSAFNRNKKSVAVDLKSEDGRAAFFKLVATADIVLENYGPGTMERLGCGWDVLEKVNPRLLYLALKGYLAGPYEKRAALDEVVQFHAGLAYMTGPPGRPLRAGASIIDILGAAFGVIAVQTALRERDTTGKGQRVSASLFETAAFLMSPAMAGIAITGEDMPPMPARRGAWAIYDVFDTSDGQLFIGVTSDQQWSRFVEEFGLQELAKDPRLVTNVTRVKEREWLIPALREVIAKVTTAVASERCERSKLSFAPVGTPRDLFEDAHLIASRGLLDVVIAQTGGGAGRTAKLPALPMEFGDARERPGLRAQPPAVGQHNAEAFAAAGLSAAEIDALTAKGVLIKV